MWNFFSDEVINNHSTGIRHLTSWFWRHPRNSCVSLLLNRASSFSLIKNLFTSWAHLPLQTYHLNVLWSFVDTSWLDFWEASSFPNLFSELCVCDFYFIGLCQQKFFMHCLIFFTGGLLVKLVFSMTCTYLLISGRGGRMSYPFILWFEKVRSL